MDIEVLVDIKSLKEVFSWEEIYKFLCTKYKKQNFVSPEYIRKRYSENKYKLDSNLENIPDSYEKAYTNFCSFIGKTKEITPPKESKGTTKKILVISDFHIPFHNEYHLLNIIRKHKDADVLVIPGDYLDCYAVSRFSKKKEPNLKDELSKAAAVTDMLAKTFPKIIILDGNHSERVRKYFETRINPSLMFLVNYNVMHLLCHNHKNIHLVNDHYIFPNGNGEEFVNYFTKIGEDFVVGHFEVSSKIPVRAAQNAYNWLDSWKGYFNINNIRLFLQGHTHRISKYPLGDGKTIIGETGCIAKIQDYAIDANAKYTAHINGYWVVYQNNGITDLNRSNFYIV